MGLEPILAGPRPAVLTADTNSWCTRKELNLRSAAYQAAALPIELRVRASRSEWPDLNQRSPVPETGAIPGFATLRGRFHFLRRHAVSEYLSLLTRDFVAHSCPTTAKIQEVERGRRGRIRTGDLPLPKRTRCQTSPRTEIQSSASEVRTRTSRVKIGCPDQLDHGAARPGGIEPPTRGLEDRRSVH